MTLAFAEDRALSSLDLSTWDNSAVTSMKDVFSMMDSLNEVSLGSKFKGDVNPKWIWPIALM